MAVTVAFAGSDGRRIERRAAPVLAYLALAYLAANFGLPRLLPSNLNVYVAQPAVWLGLGALCLNLRPDLWLRPPTRVAQGAAGWVWRPRAMVLAGIAAGAFQVACFVLAGVIYGFGYSTYALGPIAVALNLAYLSCLIWGLEMARAFLLSESPERPGVAFVTVISLFAFVAVPSARWQIAGAGGSTAFEVAGQSILPAAGESFLATCLSLAGGPWAAIAYRATIAFSEWTAPVLPDLSPMLTALVGTLAPAGAFFALRSLGDKTDEADAWSKPVPGWLLALGAAFVAVIWLNTGLLGVRPALISGVSMEPELVLGDIVVTRGVAPESLRAGDVIRYRSGDVPVLHRIIEIKRGPEGLVFITQGDNNNVADAPVPTALVEGRVVLVIPKLGIIPIKLRSWLAR